jgi:hypothetical protein
MAAEQVCIYPDLQYAQYNIEILYMKRLHYISYYQIFFLCNLGVLRTVQCTVGYNDFKTCFS